MRLWDLSKLGRWIADQRSLLESNCRSPFLPFLPILAAMSSTYTMISNPPSKANYALLSPYVYVTDRRGGIVGHDSRLRTRRRRKTSHTCDVHRRRKADLFGNYSWHLEYLGHSVWSQSSTHYASRSVFDSSSWKVFSDKAKENSLLSM